MRQRAFIIALGSAAVWPPAACAPVAMGPTTYFADPGQYEYFSCALLAERRKYWADRELDLRLLMDKAEQASGGTVVSIIEAVRPASFAGLSFLLGRRGGMAEI